ncbi:calcium-binding protein CBP [Manihot esculenta]|uniref:Uncharacterized protein n=1 Tax=Manihot esculenta TaxID=3983 RepID=A0ACB7H1W1_MANES|nr:calcium-binding protein CBP [Manihot esculenta]KAG8646633.1 hypothetical protein MANES_09G018001v8 [Manihot esculenta]
MSSNYPSVQLGRGYGYQPPQQQQPQPQHQSPTPAPQPYPPQAPAQPYPPQAPAQPYPPQATNQPCASPAPVQPYPPPAPCQDQPYGAPQENPHCPAPPHGDNSQQAPYGSPFGSLAPSGFPPGTDPHIISSFQLGDHDGSGFIEDKELQRVLASYSQKFSLRTIHLVLFHFTNSNCRKIGPKEFTLVFKSLQNWRGIFENFDRDRSGMIDSNELREALCSLGFAVSPAVLDLLVSKFDKSGGKSKAIEYENFIECCLIVKGLTEKFKEKDCSYSGSATFTYEAFMLTVLPFLII